MSALAGGEPEGKTVATPLTPSGSVGTLAEMYDAHADHVFDYCMSLLDDPQEAASATEATLIAGHFLIERLANRSRTRAWLLALARRECLGDDPGRAIAERAVKARARGTAAARKISSTGKPTSADVDADTQTLSHSAIQSAARPPASAPLRAFPDQEREVLDLLFRHDIAQADIAAVLGVPAKTAQSLAASAAHALEQEPGLAPLTELPASVWRRTAKGAREAQYGPYREAIMRHMGPLRSDGFPDQPDAVPALSRKHLVLASIAMAGLLLAPAAAGAAGY